MPSMESAATKNLLLAKIYFLLLYQFHCVSLRCLLTCSGYEQFYLLRYRPLIHRDFYSIVYSQHFTKSRFSLPVQPSDRSNCHTIWIRSFCIQDGLYHLWRISYWVNDIEGEVTRCEIILVYAIWTQEFVWDWANQITVITRCVYKRGKCRPSRIFSFLKYNFFSMFGTWMVHIYFYRKIY
jgi:hypothetical protein